MSAVHCSYCGAITDNPVPLRWAMDGKDGESPIAGTLLLCRPCSNSWCRQEAGGARMPSEQGAAAPMGWSWRRAC
jgi:hypothetical protein